MMDVLPTLAGRAGVKVPGDRVLDGMDVWPALIGEARPREVFHYFRGPNLEAVRKGPWKLHLKSGELYQLEEDIGETKDVAGANAGLVAELRVVAAAMNEELGEGEFGPGCRPLGRVKDPVPLIGVDGTIRAGFERK
jgi:arylsulfatase A-like enzyme